MQSTTLRRATFKSRSLSVLHRVAGAVPPSRGAWRVIRSVLIALLAPLGSVVNSGTPPIDWELVHVEEPVDGLWQHRLDCIAYGNGAFVAFGGTLADREHPGKTAIVVSTNGTDWARLESPTGQTICNVVYGGGKFVAVGGGAYTITGETYFSGIILVSLDGEHWEKVIEQNLVAAGADDSGDPFYLTDVVYADDRYLAVGTGGRTSAGGSTILTSPDGTQWTRVAVDLPCLYPSRIAYGNGRYLAVGQLTWASADGLHWTNLGLQDDREGPICYHDGWYLARGGDVWTSPNGLDWATALHGETVDYDLEGLACGGGFLVAAFESGTVRVRGADGLWSTQRLASVASQDPDLTAPTGIAYGQGQFVVVGEYGQIYRGKVPSIPPSLASPMLHADGSVTVQLRVQPDRECSIAVSEDLVTWRTLTSVTTTTSAFQVRDLVPPKTGQRFYRAESR
jgi:hypothetical protein